MSPAHPPAHHRAGIATVAFPPLTFASDRAATAPYRQRAAYAASQVLAAVSFLELVDADREATQLLRARFEQARSARLDLAAWEALHVAADELVAAWNPYLTPEHSDPYAAALFSALRRS